MTTETQEREITRGDNNPPELLPSMPLDVTAEDIEKLQAAAGPVPEADPPFDVEKWTALAAQVMKFTDACGAWREIEQINSQAQSERLTDFITGARALWKTVDDLRTTEKKVYDDLGKLVQAAFTPLLDKLKRSADTLKPMQADWLNREQARINRERAAAAAEAEAKRIEAARLLAEATARNDVSGEVEAEALAKEAAKEEKVASRPTRAKAGTATGAGRSMAMRTVVDGAEIESIGKAIMHYKDHPDLRACIVTLAMREARAKDFNLATDTIPGIKITTKKVAA